MKYNQTERKKLGGNNYQVLQHALLEAFPGEDELSEMLQQQLSTRLDVIVASSSLSHMMFDLLRWAEMNGTLDDLVHGALRMSENPDLLKAHEKLSDESVICCPQECARYAK